MSKNFENLEKFEKCKNNFENFEKFEKCKNNFFLKFQNEKIPCKLKNFLRVSTFRDIDKEIKDICETFVFYSFLNFL